MKRLLIITLVMITATVYAAGKQYYDYPDATVIKNTDRMLIYQNASGSKNLTGSGLKSIIQQTAWDPNYPRVFQAVSSAANINKQAAIVSFVRARRGVITKTEYDNGSYFIGVPGYNHTYIYPFNGMTNVSRTTPLVVGAYWLTRGYVGQKITINGGPSFAVSALKSMGTINGRSNFDFIDQAANQTRLDAFFWGTNSVGALAANTTYTIRSQLAASWDGTNGLYSVGNNPCTYAFANGSSAKVMINYSSALCRSTFRTGSI